MTAKKKKQTKSFQTPFQVRTLPNTTDSDDDKNPLLLENLKQNTVDLDHFRPPLTHHDFFGLTDTWFQTGNAALFAAYGLMYGLHFINESMIPKLALNVLVCGWNYFDFVGRMFIHIYNIVEIVRGHREKKNKIALEIADMTASSVLVTGTTLSLLANVHVLTGTLAVACAPLASLTPAFCSIVLGFIEYSKCYKEAQKLKLPILLRDRLKKYKRSKRKLESRKKLSETHRKELEEERGAMLEQAFAIARVAYAKKEIDKDGLSALLEQLELNLDVSIVTQQPNLDRLTRSPQQRDRDMVNFALSKQRETVRSHGFNGSFWLLVGTGCALASVATFFCPILLAPAIAVIAMAITIKTMELLEIDKRIHNRCCDEKNQKTIEFDNLVINYLAHRQKAKAIRREYKERDDNTL
ncbi:MAG: hypothetical protein KDH94_07800, partial [Coxiellaceae bacterium]|nr:hypothetical protein [Coxiellaceae bacterium]